MRYDWAWEQQQEVGGRKNQNWIMRNQPPLLMGIDVESNIQQPILKQIEYIKIL